MVQRMRAAQEALESEAKEEEFYLKALITKVRVGGARRGLSARKFSTSRCVGGAGLGVKEQHVFDPQPAPGPLWHGCPPCGSMPPSDSAH